MGPEGQPVFDREPTNESPEESVHQLDNVSLVEVTQVLAESNVISTHPDAAPTPLSQELQQEVERRFPNIERRGFSEVTEVAPDVYRVANTFRYPGMHAPDVPSSFVFAGEKGLLVTDPGGDLGWLTGGNVKQDGIEQVRTKLRAPIHAVLLSHGDPDHTNNYEQITGGLAPIYVGEKGRWSVLSPDKFFLAHTRKLEKDLAVLEDPTEKEKPGRHAGQATGEMATRDFLLRHLVAPIDNPRGANDPVEQHSLKAGLASQFRDYPESFKLKHGHLEIHPLPGHAPEEVGFYLPESKVFVGGDLVVTSPASRAERANMFMPDANVYQAVESLEHLLTLDIESFYPAHGEPIVGRQNVQERLQAILDDAKQIIRDTQIAIKEHPDLQPHELRNFVFQKDRRLKNVAPREEESWILSVLRDQPENKTGEV